MIRALIVEDAPIVRKGVRLLLAEEKDIEIVGEACDGPDAVAQIRELRPDLLFLDVRMPGFDGFEVLERSKESRIRALIFITAHADYAMRAFQHDAVSYLLKPIDPARFREVVNRARLLLREPKAENVPDSELTDVAAFEGRPADTIVGREIGNDRFMTRMLVKQGDRFLMVKTEEINWIAATGEYATLHTGRGSWLIRAPLSELEESLNPALFARIHRGTIINLDRVREIQPRSHGDCDVVLQDGQQLRLSRSYRDKIFPKLR